MDKEPTLGILEASTSILYSSHLTRLLNQNREIMTLQQEKIFLSKILRKNEYLFWKWKCNSKISFKGKNIYIFLPSYKAGYSYYILRAHIVSQEKNFPG